MSSPSPQAWLSSARHRSSGHSAYSSSFSFPSNCETPKQSIVQPPLKDWTSVSRRRAHVKTCTSITRSIPPCLTHYPSISAVVDQLSDTELLHNSSFFIAAGSEAAATTLSGLFYYLLTNPHTLSKLTAEIRTTFNHASEITMISVQKLDYQLAAINEALRLYTPFPGFLRRVTPPEGWTVSS